MEKNRLYHMYRSVFSMLLAFVMVLSCIGTALPAQASEGVEAGGAAHENRENSGEAEPELPKTHTFVFHAEGEDYLTVILKGAETLERPKNPSSENGVFAGWYVDETCTTAFTDFDVVPEMDDGTTDIYAKFTKKTIKVTYYDTEGNVILT